VAPPLLPRLLTCLALCGLAACTPLPPRPDLPPQAAIAPGTAGRLDQLAAPAEAAHPGQSAFRLVAEGTEAFVTRAQSARVAVRSLDVQTYIWHADLTGMFLTQQLLDAADRGVRVRLLLDDMDARAKNAGLAALAAHPNISVRLVNPFASRWGALRMAGEGLASFSRLNHRMHNKSWIADNRLAVVGGRNIGNEYFGASDEVNFVDLDFTMAGPIVRDVSASFDRYWNSPLAYPMEVLDPDLVTAPALERLRTALREALQAAQDGRYARALREDDAVRRLAEGDWAMEWSARYRFVSDDPRKSTLPEGDPGRTHVAAALVPMLQAAQASVTIISPYFVPGADVTRRLARAAREGRSVRILTNSLAANDVAAVHGGYSKYRQELVDGGVQLWELKPVAAGSASRSYRSSGASLHTKALTVDGRALFVGSFNLDPRSTWLNCEQGVLVESPVLAAQLERIFERQTSGERAWRVTARRGALSWSDDKETFDSDPQASAWKRFSAWFFRALGLESQL